MNCSHHNTKTSQCTIVYMWQQITVPKQKQSLHKKYNLRIALKYRRQEVGRPTNDVENVRVLSKSDE